jgi:hypothetical protein
MTNEPDIPASNISREQVLDALQNDWATYVERFHRLSPETQSAFLAQQGYARLADLLAHFVAWWEQGLPAVEKYLVDPSFKPADQDVDTFNARAVARFQSMDESTVIQTFERMCQAWVDLVTRLPEQAFQNEKIAFQLHIELIGHLAEHAL